MRHRARDVIRGPIRRTCRSGALHYFRTMKRLRTRVAGIPTIVAYGGRVRARKVSTCSAAGPGDTIRHEIEALSASDRSTWRRRYMSERFYYRQLSIRHRSVRIGHGGSSSARRWLRRSSHPNLSCKRKSVPCLEYAFHSHGAQSGRPMSKRHSRRWNTLE